MKREYGDRLIREASSDLCKTLRQYLFLLKDPIASSEVEFLLNQAKEIERMDNNGSPFAPLTTYNFMIQVASILFPLKSGKNEPHPPEVEIMRHMSICHDSRMTEVFFGNIEKYGVSPLCFKEWLSSVLDVLEQTIDTVRNGIFNPANQQKNLLNKIEVLRQHIPQSFQKMDETGALSRESFLVTRALFNWVLPKLRNVFAHAHFTPRRRSDNTYDIDDYKKKVRHLSIFGVFVASSLTTWKVRELMKEERTTFLEKDEDEKKEVPFNQNEKILLPTR